MEHNVELPCHSYSHHGDYLMTLLAEYVRNKEPLSGITFGVSRLISKKI